MEVKCKNKSLKGFMKNKYITPFLVHLLAKLRTLTWQVFLIYSPKPQQKESKIYRIIRF